MRSSPATPRAPEHRDVLTPGETRAPSDEGTPEQGGSRGRRLPAPAGPEPAEALAGTTGSRARSGTELQLAEVVASAARLVPGAQSASVAVVEGGQVAWPHTTSELSREIDRLHAEVGEGPAFDALHRQVSVRVSDLGDEQRWPGFSGPAHRLGVRSMLSCRLHVQERTLGALTLLSRRADAFDPEAQELGLVLAHHAAHVLDAASKVEQLHRAVDSRDLIGQAKGILMERHHLDQERAFAMLARISQATHRKLHDVARELVTTGGVEELDLTALLPR